MRGTVIVSGVRTHFGKFGGILKDIQAVDLDASVIREALERTGVSGEQVDQVIMGMVRQSGTG